jgi:hypothetical protein
MTRLQIIATGMLVLPVPSEDWMSRQTCRALPGDHLPASLIRAGSDMHVPERKFALGFQGPQGSEQDPAIERSHDQEHHPA